ncbi:MAG: hypothetical protein FWH19_02240 [Treponema sp.]|nr:hypothetical protein [Treponema sp.]
MKKRLLLCLLLIVSCSLILPGLDFGLTLDQIVTYSGFNDDMSFIDKGILIPWASGLLGETGEFIVSLGLNYQSDPLAAVPELLLTNLSWRMGPADFGLGRMAYSDPLGYIANGLFDGARLSFDTPAGLLSAGAWYSGLIYKRRANIEMTDRELALNSASINFDDLANTYFAPRRVLAALDWEHPGLAGRVLANLSLLGQFDLGDEDLNSQYLVGKLIIPAGAFAFELGGAFELIQQSGDMETAFAAEMGLAWKGASQGLHLMGRYASAESDSMAAFLPVTTNTHGNVLETKLSGISVISLDYTARLHRTMALGFLPSYFIYTASDQDERLLGAEIFGALYWSPVSDISINLGGGAFLPSLGNVAPNGDLLWKIEMNVIISIF